MGDHRLFDFATKVYVLLLMVCGKGGSIRFMSL